jgi:hypothetical protein
MHLEKAVAWMRSVALVCVDTFLIMSTPKGTPRPDRVTMVRVDEIGDFVLWLDAAQALVQYYKASGRGVVLIANQAWAAWAADLAIFEDVVAALRG